MISESIDNDEVENVRVVIRVRPLNKKEIDERFNKVSDIDHHENLITLTKPLGEKSKTFKFDWIFPEDSTQIDVYRHTALPLVEKVFKGYNATIFAYGQTGTGKTYTMSGEQDQQEVKGIVPNTLTHIFTQIAHSSEGDTFSVTATYLEIYNEDVRDLLSPNPNAKLEVRERPEVGVYVKDLLGFTVDSIESITKLMNRGNLNRITRSTLMNDVSSRSHAIFTITIEAKNRTDAKTKIGKLNLVDLAGSERLSRTHATGDRLKEAGCINLSLSVLGNVISALAEDKSSYIPYRNSKLTRLLQDSLGGNSKTTMIALISPCEQDFDESMCTLRFASRAKFIKNHVRINVENKKSLIECFEEEIAELQKRLALISLQEETQMQQSKTKKKGKQKSAATIETNHTEFLELEIEQNELLEKISTIQKKILVGGENLCKTVEDQYFLLEASDAELDILNDSQNILEETLNQMEAERIDVEEQYSSLQEEDEDITRKIEIIQRMLNDVKQKHAENEHEYQNEIEILIDENRFLNRELQLADMVMKRFVPKEYQNALDASAVWDSDTMDYRIKNVAHAGNNIPCDSPQISSQPVQMKPGTKDSYFTYNKKKQKRRSRSFRVRTSTGSVSNF